MTDDLTFTRVTSRREYKFDRVHYRGAHVANLFPTKRRGEWTLSLYGTWKLLEPPVGSRHKCEQWLKEVAAREEAAEAQYDEEMNALGL